MDVSFNNVKSVNISAVAKSELHVLVHNASVNQHVLFYNSGQIFIFEPYGQTDWLQEQTSRGIHWFYSIYYTPVDTFEKEYRDDKTGTIIPIVDLSNNIFWNQVFEKILDQNN